MTQPSDELLFHLLQLAWPNNTVEFLQTEQYLVFRLKMRGYVERSALIWRQAIRAAVISFLALYSLNLKPSPRITYVGAQLKERRTIFEEMTKIIDIIALFKATVSLRGYHHKWMPMLAWKSAIKREASN
jgi:hypothetical protein